MNGEPYFICAKIGHYLPQLRKEYISPGGQRGRETLETIEKWLAGRRKASAP